MHFEPHNEIYAQTDVLFLLIDRIKLFKVPFSEIVI